MRSELTTNSEAVEQLKIQMKNAEESSVECFSSNDGVYPLWVKL